MPPAAPLQVFDFELQKQLVPYMREMVPLPGIYDPAFIAANQVGSSWVTSNRRETTGYIQRRQGRAARQQPPEEGAARSAV